MKRFLFCFVAAALMFAALSSYPSHAEEKISDSTQKILGSYKVSIGDKLNIQVYEEPDLSGDFEVKEDGTITYPLLGPVKVADLTKSEVENALTVLLERDYLAKPYVHISVKSYHQRAVMVLGCVQKPGTYSFPDNNSLTLLEAISMAGGFTGYASVNSTKIVRTFSDGKKSALDPHINDIISGKRKDAALEPNDLVFVPERLF